MTAPRTSSVRKVHGIPTESEKNPEGFQAPRVPPGTRDGYGMGRGTGFKQPERPPLAESLAAEFAWAEKHLPREHTGFVVAAICSLQFAGAPVSTGSVLARLKATGRDREAVNVLARRYGTPELP